MFEDITSRVFELLIVDCYTRATRSVRYLRTGFEQADDLLPQPVEDDAGLGGVYR